MAFTIRSATPADLPSIATLDIAAHQPNSAILNMNLLPPDDIHALYHSRYAHLLSQPNHYQFLVATADSGDIAGFLVGASPIQEGSEEKEWDAKFPDDADVETTSWFGGLMKVMKEDKMKYFRNDMWGMLTTYSKLPHLKLLANATQSSKRSQLLLLINIVVLAHCF